jgi:hypothetical protein
MQRFECCLSGEVEKASKRYVRALRTSGIEQRKSILKAGELGEGCRTNGLRNEERKNRTGIKEEKTVIGVRGGDYCRTKTKRCYLRY